MEAVNPKVSLQTLSAADGLLAGLLYLHTLRQAAAQCRITVPFIPQRFHSWKWLEDLSLHLENVREGILNLIPILGLKGMDATLDSFVDPATFFQATVLSLRNALIGQPPSSLGDVVALYSTGDTQPYIDQWQNAISRYDHRQAFANLIEALFPEITKSSPASTADYSDPGHFIYQDTPFEIPQVQGNDLMGFNLACSDAKHGLLAVPDLMQNDCFIFSGEIQPAGPQTSALGPCGSALVTNLVLFLEQGGELFQVLSGRWVTAKHQYVPSSTTLNLCRLQGNDVKSCIQCMRQGESFQDPSSLGILSIVDLFIKLGYLQTPEDVQEYMIIVGKVRRRIIENEYSAVNT
ncbi:hypothetical protein FBEOM_11866 [Fusarium beomiforme]|uniref:Uncharacterized protein n=1 Tax=Fusarium beomiforme TaxID=44412 RepID=A0A9P5DTZ3_9HYPO|nr:hypothetical protein FBEOM_11866 [Fusarium beomiforme]